MTGPQRKERRPGYDQERPSPPIDPPTSLSRTASRKQRWGLSRRLIEYQAVGAAEIQIGGTAPKWVLKRRSREDDYLIAKIGAKNGRIEVLTELFNNMLGQRLGFKMAECGLARLGGEPYFISRYFLQPGERLVHGSLMIEDVFAAKGETDRVRHRDEQRFYTLDFLRDVIGEFCGVSAPQIFGDFCEMLIFDALIGSTDRHAQNWGVIIGPGGQPRFAPIFDSAHALLWEFPDRRLDRIKIELYVGNATPCIGRPGFESVRCNHFALCQTIFSLTPASRSGAMLRIVESPAVARELLSEFPFERAFSGIRKRLIVLVLQERLKCLLKLAELVQP